jgi:hypothetical protein
MCIILQYFNIFHNNILIFQILREVLAGPLGWRALYAGIGIKTLSMGAAGALMALFLPLFEALCTRLAPQTQTKTQTQTQQGA